MRFISYYRVSTESQRASGLGLEAQERAVVDYVARTGGRIIDSVTEVESGKRNDRPQIAEALRLCRVHKATLLIAKIDRLARNVAFVSTLMESGLDFVAVDFPQATPLTIHILAAMAEFERQQISNRTKAGLESARRRGVRLGKPENLSNRQLGSARGVTVRKAQADSRARDIAPEVAALQAEGATTLRALAAGLTAKGVKAPRGGDWSAIQVSRELKRLTA